MTMHWGRGGGVGIRVVMVTIDWLSRHQESFWTSDIRVSLTVFWEH